MPRQFKIEVKDGIDYGFWIHNDDKIEMMGSVDPFPFTHFVSMLAHIKSMVEVMRDSDLASIEITKI